MARLSKEQTAFLKEATSRYHESLPGTAADEYLREDRNLGASDRMWAKVQKFRLGYVEDPLPGHEQYQGMLAIPYLRRSEARDEFGRRQWSTVSIRFRCLVPGCQHEFHGKYNSVEGDRPTLFNTVALLKPTDKMLICEGELDALTAQVHGFDAVGVPGVQLWKKSFTELLLGYETVFIAADGDDPGRDFAKKVRAFLPNGRIVRCPPGQDINSWITNQEGYNEFRELVGNPSGRKELVK